MPDRLGIAFSPLVEKSALLCRIKNRCWRYLTS